MPYQVDRSLPTKDLVLGLINHDNGTSFTSEQVLLGDTPNAVWVNQRNTKLVITETMGMADVPTAAVLYNRMNIGGLFSVVNIDVREVDIKADGSVEESLVLAEIERKYGLRTADGFYIEQVGENYVFKASATNLAYIGEVPIRVESALQSRVSIRLLDGFDLVKDLTAIITVTEPGYIGDTLTDVGFDAERASTGVVWERHVNLSTMFTDNGDGTYTPTEALRSAYSGATGMFLEIDSVFERVGTEGTYHEGTYNTLYRQISALSSGYISAAHIYVNEGV